MKDQYHCREDRRSHSLDGDGEPSKAVLEHQKLLIHLDKNKNKSTWNKVKMIVTNRTSRKSVKSNGSNNSRDVSPIENVDYSRDRADSLTSSPSYAGAYNLNIPDYDYCLLNQSDDNESKSYENRQGKSHRGSKKNKHVPEIESLPEGVPFEKSFKQKPIPKPLNLHLVRTFSDDFEVIFYTNFLIPRKNAMRIKKILKAIHQAQQQLELDLKKEIHHLRCQIVQENQRFLSFQIHCNEAVQTHQNLRNMTKY